MLTQNTNPEIHLFICGLALARTN